jgi:hypothetical protein
MLHFGIRIPAIRPASKSSIIPMGTDKFSPQPVHLTGPDVLRYSYNQFFVYDSLEKAPGCLWTNHHWRQGFARRDSTICFSTLNQAGKARLSIVDSAAEVTGTVRAIRAGMQCPSGKARIEGPDEYPIERFVRLSPGDYSVTLSQRIDTETGLWLYLSFDQAERVIPSQILKADALLEQSIIPLETADEA